MAAPAAPQSRRASAAEWKASLPIKAASPPLELELRRVGEHGKPQAAALKRELADDGGGVSTTARLGG
jgi:hypothetical protein